MVGIGVSVQQRAVHDCGCGCSGIFRRRSARLGDAGILDAAFGRAADRRQTRAASAVRMQNWLDIIGRVKPGTDPKALESQLRTELRQWQMSHSPTCRAGQGISAQAADVPLSPGGAGVTDMREQYEDALRILLIAAACVLLIACANLANLLLARGLRNRQQTSLRIALGASRGRLVRKALVESLRWDWWAAPQGWLWRIWGPQLVLHLAFTGPNMLGSDRRISFGCRCCCLRLAFRC